MKDKFTSVTTAFILSGNSAGQDSVSFGGLFQFLFDKKINHVSFLVSVINKQSIFEGFLPCCSKDRKVLFNGVTKIWKSRIIGCYEDRLVSIFVRLVLTVVAAWTTVVCVSD